MEIIIVPFQHLVWVSYAAAIRLSIQKANRGKEINFLEFNKHIEENEERRR